ncbi:MAG TPA: hypothetical protein VEZ17_16685 [Chitinophagaceae bacterium]|nr:hypothetical protein [Chitinophagaceae bacterium]
MIKCSNIFQTYVNYKILFFSTVWWWPQSVALPGAEAGQFGPGGASLPELLLH